MRGERLEVRGEVLRKYLIAMPGVPYEMQVAMQEQVMRLGVVDVIGHITRETTGAYLVTPDGSDIRLRAQGFKE